MRLIHRNHLTFPVAAGVVLSGFVGFGVLLPQTVGAATPPPPSATGCTPYPGGLLSSMCMSIIGNGQQVDGVSNAYTTGINGTNICYPKSYWRGDRPSGGWTDYYSAPNSNCYILEYTQSAPISIIGKYVANSYFYGWFGCNLWSGWGPAVRETIL